MICGGGGGDRQAPAGPVVLEVVVDQHGCAVGVVGQAVQRQREDFLGAAAGVDEDLDGGADLRGAQQVEVVAQLAHDPGGQVPARFGQVGFGGDVVAVDRELVAEPGGRPARRGCTQLPQRGYGLADLAAGQQPGQRADRAGGLQVGQSVEEHLDVGAAQHRRVVVGCGLSLITTLV